YYGPYLDHLVEIKVVDKTTAEVYLKDYGWVDPYSYTEFVILPKHVFERLTNPLEDPSTLPHPTVPGLPAMIGQGPYALAKIREIAYAELVWNPWYFYRHPERTVKFAAVAVPTTVGEGTSFKIQVTLEDYLGARATNASVTVKLVGPVTLTFTATHIGEGVYEATVPGLKAGTYAVEIYAEQPVMKWSVDNKYTTTLTVTAAVGPGVGPIVGPVIERPPAVVIEIPGMPPLAIAPPPMITFAAPEVKITTPAIALTSAEAVPEATQAVGAVAPATLSYGAIAISVVALGISVAIRRR
ncbi:MAG: hypothetical protein RMH84_03835, partial [Sulfolobales archaeon]|nr:hypothetical protein [Sulfolobales archaeon]